MNPNARRIQREPRFLVEAGATVKMTGTGQTHRAITVNMSGGGVLLRFASPVQLAVGDSVECEFKVAGEDDKPLPYWGLGNIIRLEPEKDCVAIVLKCGGYSPIDPKTGVAFPRITNPEQPTP